MSYIYSPNIFSRSSSSSDEFIKPFLILNVVSYILLVGIFAAIFNAKSTEKDQFQYVYYMSKIMTVKSIILENHYSEILVDFSNSGEPITLSTTYRNFLKLVKNKNQCISGYKPCGILDTYGNVLCYDEFLDCPINRIKVDHINKAFQYSSQNYRSISLTNIPDNHKLFYSNNYDEGNVVTIIIKTKDEPKYLTNSNFILDSEVYKEIFGDQEFLNSIADIFGLRDDEKEKDDDEDVADKIITIFKVINEVGEDLDYADIALKGAKLLYTILTYEYNKIVEKFDKYVKEQIEILDEGNIDTFFDHIGNNIYTKNYIGFKSVDDINKFMRFDYNIYKKKFPSFEASKFALVGLVFMSVMTLIPIYILFTGSKEDCFFLRLYYIIPQCVFFYGFSLGFLIYALVVFINVNKNKKLDELKSIKSDEFINSIIDDFVSECKKNALIIATFIINSISIIIHIIAMILYSKSSL